MRRKTEVKKGRKNPALKGQKPNCCGVILNFAFIAYMLGRNLTQKPRYGIINCIQKGLKGAFCPVCSAMLIQTATLSVKAPREGSQSSQKALFTVGGRIL